MGMVVASTLEHIIGATAMATSSVSCSRLAGARNELTPHPVGGRSGRVPRCGDGYLCKLVGSDRRIKLGIAGPRKAKTLFPARPDLGFCLAT